MKRRFAASLAATALSITALTGIVATPAAQAVTAGGSTYTTYSAITDIFSCKYYPTRPWC
ncbi:MULTISPECIES: hypothetical protein [Corynebacterium]|uniref:hypothetical protein n=1 Tax=Corynebacterium TaxID=1716 RepID=UPI0011A15B0B|nr:MULTISPECIES: hypothetical protein [Corynebacterium]MCT1414850.1 hypothetical protein [Corynebacterium sanguinis]MCT1598393.1 hypothetical protein [Corynebacterium sanguinis]MCT2154883.1 hypothetical protein [Corynebacterium sanguinis]TVS22414.1 hypothetical protein EKI51_09605 [Corynebacterium sanguinis]WNI12170.1 hypothetical protein RIU96_07975 [Corynebacterium sp. Z-1]